MSADFRNWRTKRRDRISARCSRRGKLAWREGGTLRTRMAERDLDYETIRARALDDKRGEAAGVHSFPVEGGFSEVWETRRAVTGRTDQFEVYVETVLCGTLGAKLMGLLIAERYRRGPMSAEAVKAWISKMRPKKNDILKRFG